jgi:CelD/BcsL family acetyltransferase involved in cellulose biosynthesis
LGREMSKRFLSRGWLDFWLLKLDGHIAAIEYGFRYNAVYYPLWVALDTHFHAFSPGAVLRSHIIQELIRDGVRVYEFMQGNEPYKRRWGPGSGSYTTVVGAAPRSVGSIYLRLSAWNSAARMRLSSLPHQCKEGLRSVLPARMWNLMRMAYNRFRSGNELG